MEKIILDSVSIRVYKSLKNFILAKDINGKINQEEVAKNLGVSRTPVMYALNRLHAEGFVELLPYKGYFVRKYDAKEFSEILEARLLFESYGVEKIIKNLSEKDIRVLQNFIKRFKKYYEKNDIGKYRGLDISFHNYIINKTNNRYIIKEYKDYIMIPIVSSGFIPPEISIKQHENLVASIISKDLKKSKEIIEEHIKSLILK